MADPPAAGGPAVVALGGGHGLATALRAVRRYASSVTAVVSVADDGGSSGRLRRDLGVPPPGDIRRCLVALAGDGCAWAPSFEHRFADGELAGHALGNLVLVGLDETSGSFTAALDEAARLLGAVGRVVPATVEPVVLEAELTDAVVEGQAAVAKCTGIRRIGLVPGDAAATPDAVEALAAADQIVYAPGSLYTSVLPVLCVAGLRDAIAASPARVVQVANLRPQIPETAGMDAADHLEAVLAHGARVDTFLHDAGGGLAVDPVRLEALGVETFGVAVARPHGLAHDPERLAVALETLV